MSKAVRKGERTRFPAVHRQEAGMWRVYSVATCSCGATDEVRSSGNVALPEQVVANKLRQRGWLVGPLNKRRDDTCPRCAAAPPKAERIETVPKIDDDKSRGLSPAQRRAAYCRIAGVPKSQEIKPVSHQIVTTPARAEPPPQPTVIERRRILDALEAHYLVEKACYAQRWSDDALAQKLNVPRTWVTEIRVGFFGDGGGNEAKDLRDAAISKLEQRLSALEQDLLTKFADETEAIKREIDLIKKDADRKAA